MADANPTIEQIKVKGDEMVAKVRELIAEGNVRRLIIKNNDGKTLVEIPLTWGVIGGLLSPVAAGLGAIAALVTDCTIEVERREEPAEATKAEVVED